MISQRKLAFPDRWAGAKASGIDFQGFSDLGGSSSAILRKFACEGAMRRGWLPE
jgi:hypothetical protein